MRARFLILALPLLAACQLALPGGGDRAAVPQNPVTVGAVQVTSLDAPTPAPALAPTPAPALAPALAPASPPAASAAPLPGSAATPATAATTPAATTPVQSEAEVAPSADPNLLSPQELACRASGGTWGRYGKTSAHSCFRNTKDAGKSCRRQTDCDTQCLARSRTCAPVTPLIGCHPVLQSDGSEVTLCID